VLVLGAAFVRGNGTMRSEPRCTLSDGYDREIQVSDGVGQDEGWPLYLTRYALLTERR
jgi:hypothetical protein